MKKTEWFPPKVKPTRVGWYDTYKRFKDLNLRRHWNGVWWSRADVASLKSPDQNMFWRGRAEKPE